MELVSLGVEKLWDRLSQEYEQYKGVEDQVRELKSNLNLLKSFLKDADAKKHTDKMVRHCVEEIKEIVYDAEDIVETCILKEIVGKKSGIVKRVKGFASKVVDRRELASDIRGISKRILKVTSDMEKFGVQKMIADGSWSSSHPPQEREREMRQEFARDYESDLVGLDASVKKLVGYLVEKDDIQIVSVTGMGGLGKTTLARQVFNHEDVKRHFDGLAWVCVSKDFTRKDVWQAIFRNLKPNEEEEKIFKMTEATLVDKLSLLLETSKSLIVIDDIWKKEDWDLIKIIFPQKKGWTVLLTSRDESIIVNGGTSYINFKADCLTSEDSWTLFQRIAFPRKYTAEFKVDEEMEELGNQMIKHCGGLPLAVKVLGGLLAENYVHDWKRLSENIGSHIVQISGGKKGSIDKILSMSFEGLPSYLKQCFLYLAHFPEDYAINVGELSYHWAAEGIPKPSYYNGATIRDVGDSYVEELLRRNMVTAKRDSFTSRFETLQLHDMMREVCLLKAKEENFLHIDGSPSSTADDQSPHPSRRFVSQNPYRLDVTDKTNPKLRSFVIVNKRIDMSHPQTRWQSWVNLTFSRLQLLRVLDLYATNIQDVCLPSDIGKLIHLRYLSLEMAWLFHIPSTLQNLKLLIYLNLCLAEGILVVPNVFMGMHELRYLALPEIIKDGTKLELSKLENLETLENFSTKHSNVEDLHGMSKLRILSVMLNNKTSIKTLSSSIGGMRQLEHLTIKAKLLRKKIRGDELSLGFVHLKRLKLRIYMPRLPDQQHFPYRLTFLDLSECGLEEDPMPILEKLLQLKEITLRKRSFVGRKMVFSRGGFPQLQKLAFFGLEEWEEWIVEEGSMPLLHTLKIWGCSKLKELPDAQQFPSHLTIISIKDCGLEVNPMPILEKLLHLKKVSLHDGSFCGRKMVCSAGGFPQLHELDLSGLEKWEEWVIEEGSMPLLHTLYIGGYNFPELPDGLRFITSLKSLDCELSGYGWDVRVSKGGEDYYKVQHIPYVRILGEEGSMPLLHTLNIWECPKLKQLSDGLRCITSLKELNIGTMEGEFKKNVSKGGEDYY